MADRKRNATDRPKATDAPHPSPASHSSHAEGFIPAHGGYENLFLSKVPDHFLRCHREVLRPLYIGKKRHVGSIFLKRIHFQTSADATLSIRGVGQNLAVVIHNHRTSSVNVLRIAPDAVDADNVRLILDGARLQQPHPMMNSFHR